MYSWFVKRKIRNVFERLNQGQYEPLVEGMATRFVHTFPGDHPLGGSRQTKKSLRKWFERLYMLFPNLHLTLKNIFVQGNPLKTIVIVQWADKATLEGKKLYSNEGMHVITLEKGEVTRIQVYLDSQKIAEACMYLANKGVKEATLPPIHD